MSTGQRRAGPEDSRAALLHAYMQHGAATSAATSIARTRRMHPQPDGHRRWAPLRRAWSDCDAHLTIPPAGRPGRGARPAGDRRCRRTQRPLLRPPTRASPCPALPGSSSSVSWTGHAPFNNDAYADPDRRPARQVQPRQRAVHHRSTRSRSPSRATSPRRSTRSSGSRSAGRTPSGTTRRTTWRCCSTGRTTSSSPPATAASTPRASTSPTASAASTRCWSAASRTPRPAPTSRPRWWPTPWRRRQRPRTSAVTPPTYRQYSAPKNVATARGSRASATTGRPAPRCSPSNTDLYKVDFDDKAGTSTWTLVNDDVIDPSNKFTFDPIGFTDHTTGRTLISQLYLACSGAAYSDDDFATQSTPVRGLRHRRQRLRPPDLRRRSLPGRRAARPGRLPARRLLLRPGAGAAAGRRDLRPQRQRGTHVRSARPDLDHPVLRHPRARAGRARTTAPSTCPTRCAATSRASPCRPTQARPGPCAPSRTASRATATRSWASAPTAPLYFSYSDGTGHPRVAISRDRGLTWGKSIDVGAPFGIRNSEFAMVVAGDGDRAAVAFLGTTTPGSTQAASFGKNGRRRSSAASGTCTSPRPTTAAASWTTVDATPKDPVQRGCIWNGGGGNPCRNLLDFNAMTIDKTGRVMVGFADGCVPPEIASRATTASPASTSATTSSGPRRDRPPAERQDAVQGLRQHPGRSSRSRSPSRAKPIAKPGGKQRRQPGRHRRAPRGWPGWAPCCWAAPAGRSGAVGTPDTSLGSRSKQGRDPIVHGEKGLSLPSTVRPCPACGWAATDDPCRRSSTLRLRRSSTLGFADIDIMSGRRTRRSPERAAVPCGCEDAPTPH